MYTINNDCSNEIIIKNSKFICLLKEIYSVSDVEKVLNNAKLEYKDATHYTYAYIIDNNKKFSDDNEPSGTAGSSIMQVLEKNNLHQPAFGRKAARDFFAMPSASASCVHIHAVWLYVKRLDRLIE